jgi:hypothetical protein
MKPSGREQFIALMADAMRKGSLVKLTLGKPAGADPTLANLFVRPVTLKAGPRFAFVWRHATKDITKNHGTDEALRVLEPLIGSDFLDAHLFATSGDAQLETGPGGPRLRLLAPTHGQAAASGNDRRKSRSLEPGTPWLRALGVTDDRGKPLAPMADKFRQIQKFSEILGHLVNEAPCPAIASFRCSTWAAARATSPSPRASSSGTGPRSAGSRRGRTLLGSATTSPPRRAWRAASHSGSGPSRPRRPDPPMS